MTALLLLVAYLIGSLPFGLYIAKSRGVDLREVGSGNIGATNVFRSVGKGVGLLTFFLDAMKGTLPTLLFPTMVQEVESGAELGLLFGCAAILGHNFPIFLKFRGGKGVATSAGVLLAAAPLSLLSGLAVFAGVAKFSGYVSLASMSAAVLIAVTGWFLYGHEGWILPGVLTALAVMVVLRHRSNIRRLLKGTESKVGSKATMNSPKE